MVRRKAPPGAGIEAGFFNAFILGAGAWVSGPAPGTPVRVLDALGRVVGAGTMPAAGGPLALSLPAGRPAGLYLVRAGRLTARLLVE